MRAESHSSRAGILEVRIGGGSLEFGEEDVASIEALSPGVNSSARLTHMPAVNETTQSLLSKAAEAEGVDANFVRSVAKIESDFKQGAISRKGAIGLMQLMPGTAKEMAVDPTRAGDNALGGAKYLRALLVRYHFNSALALAAYNAGPGTVERFGGVPPFDETRKYVSRVTREYDRLRVAGGKGESQPHGSSVGQ